MRRTVLALGTVSALAGLAAAATAAPAKPKAPRFDAPVLLTVDKYAGGYEPSITIDKYNNIFVTAHKQNHTLALSPDSRATLKVRSQSWLWTSSDGKTFTDPPGLTPLQEQNADFGDEGEVAHDDTGHTYFVDTNVTDDSFARYKATGNGQLTMETSRPVGPFGEPVDDRPWITAHGDGVVMYTGNQGDKVSYPLGAGGDSDAYGPGRYTVYMSYNHGDTFDPRGITLNDSGWCRPAADHRKGSKDLYVLCTNDGGANDTTTSAGAAGYTKGTLWAYASHDDGHTWTRSKMGPYDAKDSISTYPSVAVAKDGTIYALYNESRTVSGNPVESHLKLYTSTNRGRSWKVREVTPRPGMIRYSWLEVAPNGTIGIAYYFRAQKSEAWYVWAATAKPGQKFAAAKVSTQPIASASNGYAFGDFFEIAFDSKSRMNVVYTSMNKDLGGIEGLNTDIYYARQK